MEATEKMTTVERGRGEKSGDRQAGRAGQEGRSKGTRHDRNEAGPLRFAVRYSQQQKTTVEKRISKTWKIGTWFGVGE